MAWDDRLEMDVQYALNPTLRKDLEIIIKTVQTVLSRADVTDNKDATMSAFMGPQYEYQGYQLRPLEASDLETRVTWMKHPVVSEGITLTYEPTVEGMRQWFERVKNDPTREDFALVDSAGEVAGMCGFTNITDEGGELYLFINPTRVGGGLGTIAMKTMELYGIHQLWDHIQLETKEANSRQQNFYRKLGYAQVSTRNGKVVFRKSLPTQLPAR